MGGTPAAQWRASSKRLRNSFVQPFLSGKVVSGKVVSGNDSPIAQSTGWHKSGCFLQCDFLQPVSLTWLTSCLKSKHAVCLEVQERTLSLARELIANLVGIKQCLSG